MLVLIANALLLWTLDRAAHPVRRVTIALAGDQATATVDTGETVAATLPFRAGATIGVEYRSSAPGGSVVESGFDNLELRDANDALLLQDRFKRSWLPADSAAWRPSRRGHLTGPRNTYHQLAKAPAGDYRLAIDLVNQQLLDEVLLWVQADDNIPPATGALLRVTPTRMDWFTQTNGQRSLSLAGAEIRCYTDLDRYHVAWFAGDLLHTYRGGLRLAWRWARWAAPIALIGVLLGLAARLVPPRWFPAPPSAPPAPWRNTAVAVLVTLVAAGITARCAWLAWYQLEGIPHVQDSLTYWVGAKAIAAGYPLGPPIEESLAPYMRREFVEYDRGALRPFGSNGYAPGFPYLLAIGEKAGVPWLVNPILAGLTLVCAFVLLRALHGAAMGLAVIALMALSPWYGALSASMMLHTAILFAVSLCAMAAVLGVQQGRRRWALLAGAAYGLATFIRPIEALLFGPVLVCIWLWAWRRRGFRFAVDTAALTVAASLPLVGLTAYYFRALPLLPFYKNYYDPLLRNMLIGGIGPRELVVQAERWKELNELMLGWPGAADAGLLVLATLLVPWRRRREALHAVWLFVYVLAYLRYSRYHCNMYGPRLWLVAAVPMFVFVALTLGDAVRCVVGVVGRAWPATLRPRALLAAFGVVPVALTLAPNVAARLRCDNWLEQTLHGYNGMTRAYLNYVESFRLDNALVLLEDAPWQATSLLLAHNTPRLDGPVVYAVCPLSEREAVKRHFPHRTVYALVWNLNRHELYHVVEQPDGLCRLQPVRREEDQTAPVYNAFSRLRAEGGYSLVGTMAVDMQGRLYICEMNQRLVTICDKDGAVLREVVEPWLGRGAIPHDAAVRRDGLVLAVCGRRDLLASFRADAPPGHYNLFALRAEDKPTLNVITRPVSVAWSATGTAVLADPDRDRLVEINETGRILGTLPTSDRGTPLRNPWLVRAASNGHWLVYDGGRGALLLLDPVGGEAAAWPLLLTPGSHFIVPGVASDGEQRIFISDYWARDVIRLDCRSGEQMRFSDPDAFAYISGLAVRDRELLGLSATWRKIMRLSLEQIP